jgi:rhodanese-related sulfurtransferase
MRTRAFWLVVLAMFLGSPVLGQVADETAVPRVSVAELKKAIDAGQAIVIDVRDAGSYADGHLPGAINVPLEALQPKLATLKAAKKPIVAYCA